MKWTFIIGSFILTTLLTAHAAETFGQAGLDAKVSIQLQNSTLKKALNTLSQKAKVDFAYNTQVIPLDKKININAVNERAGDVLSQLITPFGLTYRVIGKNIVIEYVPKKSQSVENAENGSEQPKFAAVVVTGRVTDSVGTPIIGASVHVQGTTNGVLTNENGEFTLKTNTGDQITISFIGYKPCSFVVNAQQLMVNVVLKQLSSTLNEVVVSTGYQTLPKERATGSFDQIDNKLLNRTVSPDILSRLDGVTSGLIFDKNIIPGTNRSTFSVRGRSTILSNPNALIVVDNFPYDGDINNINPNDIESITVLKDAAAASIWGSFSGNGVVVITTKKGAYEQPLSISLNTNVTVGQKPNLFYDKQLSSSDYINLEEFLYTKGAYNSVLSSNPAYRYISPVVDILNQEKLGNISSTNGTAQINALSNIDARNDLSKYFYQNAVNQQYALTLSGGGRNDKFFFSTGEDGDRLNQVGNNYNRITVNGNNTYSLLDKKLQINTSITFTQSKTTSDFNGTNAIFYPYAQLADANGNPLAINRYNPEFINSTGNGLLLDWNDRPLDDLHLANNVTTLTDLRLNNSISYRIINGLNANVFYQYSKGSSVNDNDQNQQSYNVRNLINSYTQINGTTVTTPIPYGDIFSETNANYFSHDGRGTLTYDHNWNNKHQLNALAGIEVRDFETENRGYTLYGYNPTLQTSALIDYKDFFPQYTNAASTIQIPANIANLKTISHYLSYFANAAYVYDSRYTFSASARKDESNIFGVNSNQKGVPLWSIGGAWNISDEKFYKVAALPYLRLRITDGYNGNVNTSLSAYTTANYGSITNIYGAQQVTISNPPNPQLRWEKINTQNFAIDFGSKNKRITGSFEYYIKNGQDLFANTVVDPTVGVTTFTGNFANMNGHGFDLTINTQNTTGQVKWYTSLLISKAVSNVSNYSGPALSNGQLTGNQSSITPLTGYPLYSVFSFKSAGLDAQGNPQGYLNGQVSENYSGINSSGNRNDLVYNGSATPTVFGGFRNTFNWNQFSLSFNITYEFGYYFRKPTTNYGLLISSSTTGTPYFGYNDYAQRWQNPGDEKITNIPSFIYPDNASRDNFYSLSSSTIDKGDNIRLKDVQLGYDFLKSSYHKMPVQAIHLYLYANNLGILWKANKDGIDPDVIQRLGTGSYTYPNPRTISIGVKVDF